MAAPKRRVWRKIHSGSTRKHWRFGRSRSPAATWATRPCCPNCSSQIPPDQEIASVTADGAYDTRKCHDAIAERGADAVIPPRKNAKPWKADTAGAVARNEALRASKYLGRALWRRWSGYHRRSRVETKMHCVKLLGQRLMARDFDRQPLCATEPVLTLVFLSRTTAKSRSQQIPLRQRSGIMLILTRITYKSLMKRLSEHPKAFIPCRSGRTELSASEHAIIFAARDILFRHINRNPVLSSWQAVMDYCALTVRGEVERFHVLYLDRKNRLIADEHLGAGTVDHVPVYPREVVRLALDLNASALILVHNHPSGDPEPSGDDILMTEEVQIACAVLGLTLHDHIIIGAGREVSLRGRGYLG